MISSAHRIRSSEGIDGKDSVGLYLDGIAKTPLLTAEEEVLLARRIEAGLYAENILAGQLTVKERGGRKAVKATPEELEIIAEEGRRAMKQFITANLRLVVSVARKYGRSQMPLLDLVQEGNTGLIRAVEKFDYTKGNQVSATRRNLERKLGREPEIIEIADELGLEEERIVELLRLARDHVSLDAPVEEDGDTALGDLLARDTTPGPDEVVLDAEDRARLDDMLGNLDERSADVVRRRYGLLDGRQAKLADIASVWGITAERVRQIERQAIAKLRNTQMAA